MIPLCCFALTSLAILIMPFTASSETGMQQGLGYAAGILFWAGLVSGIITFIAVNRKNRKYLYVYIETGRVLRRMRFFSTKAAWIVDSILIISLTGLIVGNVIRNFPATLDFIFLFLLVTTMYLHFLVNSNMFYLIEHLKKGGKNHEKETENL